MTDKIKVRVTDPDPLDVLIATDPIIQHAISNVGIMQATPSSVLNKPIKKNKKVKVTHQMIEDAYNKLRVIIQNKNVNEGNIVVMIAYAMQLSDGMLNTSKVYKAELALTIIRKLVDDEVNDPRVRAILHNIIDVTVPHLLNSIEDLPGLIKKYLCCCR